MRTIFILMKTSKNGLEFITRWEGIKMNAYLDIAEKWTIGVGHLIKQSDSFEGISNAQVRQLLTTKDKNHPVASIMISREEAMKILAKDVEITERELLKAITVPLNQNQFDALVSFGFNCGTGVYKMSSACRLLNTGNYEIVPTKLLDWSKVKIGGVHQVNKGLLNRRKSEGELFSRSVSSLTDDPPDTLLSWTPEMLVEVQGILKNLSLYPGLLDGLFGPATKRGLEEFCRKFSVNAGGDLKTGITPEFYKRLKEASK